MKKSILPLLLASFVVTPPAAYSIELRREPCPMAIKALSRIGVIEAPLSHLLLELSTSQDPKVQNETMKRLKAMSSSEAKEAVKLLEAAGNSKEKADNANRLLWESRRVDAKDWQTLGQVFDSAPYFLEQHRVMATKLVTDEPVSKYRRGANLTFNEAQEILNYVREPKVSTKIRETDSKYKLKELKTESYVTSAIRLLLEFDQTHGTAFAPEAAYEVLANIDSEWTINKHLNKDLKIAMRQTKDRNIIETFFKKVAVSSSSYNTKLWKFDFVGGFELIAKSNVNPKIIEDLLLPILGLEEWKEIYRTPDVNTFGLQHEEINKLRNLSFQTLRYFKDLDMLDSANKAGEGAYYLIKLQASRSHLAITEENLMKAMVAGIEGRTEGFEEFMYRHRNTPAVPAPSEKPVTQPVKEIKAKVSTKQPSVKPLRLRPDTFRKRLNSFVRMQYDYFDISEFATKTEILEAITKKKVKTIIEFIDDPKGRENMMIEITESANIILDSHPNM